MKQGQIYQLDQRAAEELERKVDMLNDAGCAIQSLYNVLIEINITEDLDNQEFLHLKTYEKHNIKRAIALLGDLIERETYRVARRFGLEYPN